MDTLKLIHAVSDFATFIAYSVIAYGISHLIRKRAKHRRLLSLFAVFIATCGIVHLFHVIFSKAALDSEPAITIATLVNSFFSIWTAWVVLPFIPKIESSNMFNSDELLEARTNQLSAVVKEFKKVEAELNVYTDSYNVLTEVNKTLLKTIDITHLFSEISNILTLFGKVTYVWVAEWTEDKYSLVYSSANCPTLENLCDGVTASEFFDDQNMIVETDNSEKIAYFRIHSETKEYTLCTAFPMGIDIQYLKTIVSVAQDIEKSILNEGIEQKLKEVDAKRLEAQASLSYFETHDKTTGLSNRDHLANIVKLHLFPTEKKYFVYFLDIDGHSKAIDENGHYFGEALMIDVVSRLYAVIGKSDYLCRFGASEFLLVSQFENAADAADLAARITQTFTTPVSINGKYIELSINIGISSYPDDSNNWETLVVIADKARASAKEHGTNTFALSNKMIVDSMKKEKYLIRDLETSNISLVYQPQVNIFTNEIVGVEALARWSCDELGKVDTPTFIQMAEYAGVISKFGDWVIREACRQWRDWVNDGMPLIRLCINISALQLRDCSILPVLDEVIEKYLIPTSYLSLEVSESVLVRGLTVAEECLESIRNKGIRVSIDDFGTGYSSLSYLQNFKTDEIKIDQVFVHSTGSSNVAIVRNILKLAEDLKVSIVAEGVETADQRQVLKELGCTMAQGNLFYPPMTADKVSQLVIENKR